MTRSQELARNVWTYTTALANTHHVDKRELFTAVARMATKESLRQEGLDPERNK